MDVIELSDGEWDFSAVVVAKFRGFFGLCVNYRRINDMTVKNVYLLRQIDDYIYLRGDAKTF